MCDSVPVWVGGGGEELGWVPLGGGRRVEICMMGICGGGGVGTCRLYSV